MDKRLFSLKINDFNLLVDKNIFLPISKYKISFQNKICHCDFPALLADFKLVGKSTFLTAICKTPTPHIK